MNYQIGDVRYHPPANPRRSIHKLAVGRVFGDAIPDGQDFRLRFLDGYEIVCAWGDAGPEAKADAQGIVTNDICLHPQFQYVRGKTVRAVLYDSMRQKLIVEFTDGHQLRSGFGHAPTIEAVDVKVRLPNPTNVNLSNV